MSAMAIANHIPSSLPSLRSLHRPLPLFSSPQTLTLTLTLVPLSGSTSSGSSSRGWRRRRGRESGETLVGSSEPWSEARRRRRGRRWETLAAASSSSSSPAEELSAAEEEWLRKLPDKKKPLYSHSLPCIEAWLRHLGFRRSRDDRAVWLAENPLWHAQLSLDVTDLYIRSPSFLFSSKSLCA
ncbi:hypothetical protein ACMD2_16358 [Ananas comosus]|uniref:Uncharacterized protein n=1 Tax=Ananas comosus TaxID=4615 RepID=A0A199W7N7_ANACO|nr:hypothetical protein ACMD2_16358 [Ananas comosus]